MTPASHSSAEPSLGSTLDQLEKRVLHEIGSLATEMGVPRTGTALAALSPRLSLEVDLGFGSLERAELVVRLERAFGRSLDPVCLQLDTPAALARALAAAKAAPSNDIPAQPLAAWPPPPQLQPVATLSAALRQRAEREPNRPHVYLLEDDGRERTITFGMLHREACAVAAGLRSRGVQAGDRVGLMFPTGYDFLRAFQGILYAGAIAVPLYPPVRLDGIGDYVLRQAGILRDAGAGVLLLAREAAVVGQMLRPALLRPRLVATPQELVETGGEAVRLDGRGSDAAFIQYTSGSTGNPKGVLLTHDNLQANIRAIQHGLGFSPSDRGASWLPLYHDMGLIGTWLFCVVTGIPLALQNPLVFLTRPESWLWMIHRHRATLSAAPNFAYELCARKIPDQALEGLDLSSWRIALNGAEPVRPETIDRFVERFERYGFRREAMLPVYGLAENAVALCFPPLGRGPRVLSLERGLLEQEGRARAAPAGDRQAVAAVSVGRALPEHEVRIVDEHGKDVESAGGDPRVGRLLFRGPSAMSGYFGNRTATELIRVDGWLDSGDLAFQADGEIYITGRRKDLIIKAGRNLAPQDFETMAATVPGVRAGCVVAFGLRDERNGSERLVLVAETRASDSQARATLQRDLNARFKAALDTLADEIVLVPPRVIPKTSSGKVRRARTKELYLSGELDRDHGVSVEDRLRLGTAFARQALASLAARLARAAYVGHALVLLAIGFSAAWGLAVILPGGRVVRATQRMLSRLLLALLRCRLVRRGAALPSTGGPYVLVANHSSMVDIPTLLALLERDFVFLAKQELIRAPLVGTLMRKGRHLGIDRHKPGQGLADLSAVTRALKHGQMVLVFPEGTFSTESGLRPFRLGAFKSALESGAAVIPIAVTGTQVMWHPKARFPRPTRMEVWVGEPLHAAGDDFASLVRLRDEAAATIARQLAGSRDGGRDQCRSPGPRQA